MYRRLRIGLASLLFTLIVCTQQYAECKVHSNQIKTVVKHKFKKKVNNVSERSHHQKYNGKNLVRTARQFVGTRYKPGGKTPAGFDCSGFAYFIFKRYGIYLPSSSSEIAHVGKRIELKKAKQGDLIFFKGENKKDKHAGHVGIVVSKPEEPVKFIHSSSSKGIRYDDLETNPYFKSRFMFVRRVEG